MEIEGERLQSELARLGGVLADLESEGGVVDRISEKSQSSVEKVDQQYETVEGTK